MLSGITPDWYDTVVAQARLVLQRRKRLAICSFSPRGSPFKLGAVGLANVFAVCFPHEQEGVFHPGSTLLFYYGEKLKKHVSLGRLLPSSRGRRFLSRNVYLPTTVNSNNAYCYVVLRCTQNGGGWRSSISKFFSSSRVWRFPSGNVF